MKINKQLDIVINKNSTIHNALIQLENTKKKHLICVNDNMKLIGVVNDGDIRRSLIAGNQLDSSVNVAVNHSPVVLNSQTTQKEIEKMLSIRIRIIPIIDEKNELVGYYDFKEKKSQISIKNRSIAIIGMGYVGLTLGLLLADSGFKVFGYDLNSDLIDQLKKSIPPFYENGLEKYLKLHSNRSIKFIDNISLLKSDIYIITVGTPLKKNDKKPNIDFITKAAETIGAKIEKGDLVVLRSTVPIGCSRNIVLPILEKKSQLECGKDFFLSFAPERTAEGIALQELKTNPQIIGSFDRTSYDLTSRLFSTITNTVLNVGSLESSEFAKLIDNSFRDHLFAFSNYLALLAEQLNINLHEIIDAVNFNYKRNIIPKPSPGVGGPCLSKDPHILKSIFEENNIHIDLINVTREINELGPSLIALKLEKLLNQVGKNLKFATKISLIGLAFKGTPETSDLRDSTSLFFLELLPNKNNVFAYDPIVADEEIERLGIKPTSIEDAFMNADAVVFLNNHKSYSNIDLLNFLNSMNKPAVVIDTWYNFDPLFFKRQQGIIYGGLGHD
ncbi:UDP-glucose 6-dehydrogenase [Candidatus Magnetomorum sp. HK-1]|nr:UDP-glucose 6-dehydrogenase [Candidatus Magnetomorum sp. HK-1]